MPWIISPFNGAIVEVLEGSILLRNATVVSGPNGNQSPPAAPVQNQVVSSPSSTSNSGASTASTATSTAMQKRIDEGKYAVYSPIPEVASLQRQSRAIYETTGKWNTPEQLAINAQAESIRKGLNPMYEGGGQGFNDSQYFLPGSGSPDPSLNGISGMLEGLFGLFGQGAAGIGQGADKVGDAATGSNTNGTFMLVIGAVLLFLMMGRR